MKMTLMVPGESFFCDNGHLYLTAIRNVMLDDVLDPFAFKFGPNQVPHGEVRCYCGAQIGSIFLRINEAQDLRDIAEGATIN